jgi:hypothetical protein
MRDRQLLVAEAEAKMKKKSSQIDQDAQLWE